jgi:glycosyltransferase involved in cell wall biosynthesis
VASKVGGLAFNVQDGHTGFLVPDRNAEALAAKIRLLLKDRDLRRQLGQNAIRWARRYGWPVVANQITSLYDQVQPAVAPAARVCCG